MKFQILEKFWPGLVSIDQLESGVAALTRVANRVYEWTGAAALKLNASKTKAMIGASREFFGRIPPDLPRGIPVPYVETAENLGVTLDSKFTWKPTQVRIEPMPLKVAL